MGKFRSRRKIPSDDRHFGTAVGIGIATEHMNLKSATSMQQTRAFEVYAEV
jgi:hypothetical protein